MASTLRHLNVQNLHLLSPKGLATSMPNISIESQFCQACTLGEHNIEKTPKTSLHRMKTQFDLVHTNVYNHFTTTFLSSVHYVLTFNDNYSWSNWVFFSKKNMSFFFNSNNSRHKLNCSLGSLNPIKTLSFNKGKEYIFTG
jgi:hypothetical protein